MGQQFAMSEEMADSAMSQAPQCLWPHGVCCKSDMENFCQLIGKLDATIAERSEVLQITLPLSQTSEISPRGVHCYQDTVSSVN